jgi:hypothetical protein
MRNGVGGACRLIVNKDKLERFESDFLKRDEADYHRNLAIFEGMWREAVTLGVFPPKDPMEGIEVDLKIAKVVNSV